MRETSEASKHVVLLVSLVVCAMLLRAAQLQQSNSSMTGLSTMLQKVRRSSQKEEGGGKLGYSGVDGCTVNGGEPEAPGTVIMLTLLSRSAYIYALP